ncbi:Wzz/FepE/Etk N-terminal domain-containing protein [Alishewanella tabrizica]|uniref:LPS biosynthesis protein n=1 Tax=Alishewanella tabrizica TaxID=671278 RepID=A0ABQ2WIT3_9ALTE|nr:Wzz/FepE/Etk N-terminal domain-containing protein [Alishewanella tabrizica]GGW58786.1 LPS biosynthesis protein [Alishewanella tabrizica]
MTEQQHTPLADDEIDLRELFKALWQGKWIIIVTTLLFSVAAVFYALSLPNIYKSEVTLAPVSEESGLKIPGQLGGLAALAGVNLGGMGGGDKTGLALEILKSRDFISRFIEQNDLYLPIMAAEGWDRTTDQLLWDPKIYNESSEQWVRKVKVPFQPKPSNLETFDEFRKLFSVDQDKTSGMVKLSVEHFSPYLAKAWADKLVTAINDEMRERELTEAERSIAYLNTQISQTNIADVRSMLFSLIEEQTKTVMLANVRDEYVFKTIDPAVVSENKAKPARALIVVLAILLGAMLSALVVLVRYFPKKN